MQNPEREKKIVKDCNENGNKIVGINHETFNTSFLLVYKSRRMKFWAYQNPYY